MAFDIDNIAGAVLAIAERREAVRNDAEAICRTVNMEVGDLFAVLTHPNWQRVTPRDAMLTGVAAGVALARGDTPSGGSRPGPRRHSLRGCLAGRLGLLARVARGGPGRDQAAVAASVGEVGADPYDHCDGPRAHTNGPARAPVPATDLRGAGDRQVHVYQVAR